MSEDKKLAITLKDVDPSKWVGAYASHLKKEGKLQVPKWVDIVKTGNHKESKTNEDFRKFLK